MLHNFLSKYEATCCTKFHIDFISSLYAEELCVCSLLRQVTSSVKVKVKFTLEETTKAQRRSTCRGSVTGFYSEEVFLRHHHFTNVPDTFVLLSLITRDLDN